MVSTDFIISHLQVHTETGCQQNACVVLRDKKIQAIHSADTLSKSQSATMMEFPPHYHLMPGFIDMHVHGADGCDVMDATPEALTVISQALAREGTTSFLATTMTASTDDIEKTLSVVGDYRQTQAERLEAQIIGIHLEGPFLSPRKVGAQCAAQILMPNKELVERWQTLSQQSIKLVTLAPELPTSLELIRYLKKQNILASIGHTDATFTETLAGIDAGCTYATHVFNAMRGIHQREPGAVSAVLLSDQVLAEMILDGVHLHPAIVKLLLKLKGPRQLALVTDAMRAKCLGNGVYDLGGQQVTVNNEWAQLADGTLAGSLLKMNVALRNLLQFTDCNVADAIQMTAQNQAKALGLFAKKGSITVGKEADLVVLDDQFDVVMTVCGGKIIYKK